MVAVGIVIHLHAMEYMIIIIAPLATSSISLW
jgi:hypothetical protein